VSHARFPRRILALLTPFVALVAAWLLGDFTRPHVWFLFYPAVFVSSWIGGRRLGIIATAIASGLVWWFLMPPERTPAVSPGQLFSIGIFSATGIAFAFFHDRLTRAVAAVAAQQELEQVANELHRANNELLDAREFLENVLESSTEYSIIAKDLDRRILAWNAGARRNYGYEAAEVIGRSADFLHMPDEIQSGIVAALHRRALETGHATGLFRRRRKDRSEFLARVTITRRSDARGNAIGYLLVSHDVTAEQRRLDEQGFLAEVGETLQASLDPATTIDGLAQLVVGFMGDCCTIDVVDENGDVRRLKAAHADPSKGALAAAFSAVPPDPDRPHPFWRVLETKQPVLIAEVTRELLISIARNEEHRRLLESLDARSWVLVPLIARSRIIAVLSVVSCRADRKYGAEDLRLAEEVARRASLALENARLYEVAQQAIGTRDQILGVVAHDLRNPLGVILMQARAMGRWAEQPDPRSRRPREVIERAATRMNRLIQDLLEVTRLEAGPLRIEAVPVPAGEIVSESVDAQKTLAASAGLQLDLELAEDLPEIWADRHRILQVFENLLGNAMKFTPPGGRVTAGAAPSRTDVVFWVADTGAGIAEEDMPRLFERFWQAKNGRRQGAGLGLPIVKGIVEAHSGRIWVESALDQGTKFFFTIPTATRASASSESSVHDA